MNNVELLQKIKEDCRARAQDRSRDGVSQLLNEPWCNDNEKCAKEIGLHVYRIAELMGIEEPRGNVAGITRQLKQMRTAGDLISFSRGGNSFIMWWPAGFYEDLLAEVNNG